MREVLIRCLSACGLKRPLARLHFAWRTRGVNKVIPRIVRTLPHDPGAYTQGLAWSAAGLYESTGLAGASSLRLLDRLTGTVLTMKPVDRDWCEGIAIQGDRLVQLTYTAERALCYALPALEVIGEYSYRGEGWGLARFGDGYIMSDGSDNLRILDGSFSEIRRLPVRLRGKPLARINDLEVSRDRLYANVQFDQNLYEIDLDTGVVLRIIDCRALVENSGRRDHHDMLNGIACDADGLCYVTGKRWSRLYVIDIPD